MQTQSGEVRQFTSQIAREQSTVLIIPEEDVLQTWADAVSSKEVKAVAGAASPVFDTKTLGKTLKDMGMAGRYYVQKVDGKSYVILKGYPGKRDILQGTRYLAGNPKIVDMMIGPRGIKQAAAKGGMLTIILYGSLSVLEALLRRSDSLSLIAGRLTADILKVGVASIIGAIAGLTAGAFTTLAAAPIVMAIGFSILAGMGVQAIDDRLGFTQMIAKAYMDAAQTVSRAALEGAHGWWNFATRPNQY